MQTKLIQAADLAAAQNECAWAAKIVEVDGGYMCFESLADYETWAKQA